MFKKFIKNKIQNNYGVGIHPSKMNISYLVSDTDGIIHDYEVKCTNISDAKIIGDISLNPTIVQKHKELIALSGEVIYTYKHNKPLENLALFNNRMNREFKFHYNSINHLLVNWQMIFIKKKNYFQFEEGKGLNKIIELMEKYNKYTVLE